MSDPRLRAAYAECARLAREHYENFPVASLLLPRAMRPHVAAVYAFARVADDFADEGTRSVEERLRLLDDWSARLHRHPEHSAHPEHLFVALHNTIREKHLPVSLLDDLLSAFRQDVTVRRYATWDDLLDYCLRSANPVGRLMLQLYGAAAPGDLARSDAICTALQLVNFWQDVALDWRKGRIYLPQDEMARFRVSE
ncbi:MAG: squalene synthase HpnC, partial [Steroidobacteraceae bacterium]